MKQLILTLLFLFFLFACEEEETPLTPIKTITNSKDTNSVLASVNLESDYRYQIFYSSENKTTVSQNLKSDWNLSLSDKGEIWINTSSSASIAKSTKSFDETTSTSGLTFNFEHPSHNKTPLLSEEGTTYVLQLGYDLKGAALGYKKVTFKNKERKKEITYANLDGTNTQTVSLNVGEELSFEKGPIDIIPNNSEWDLLFGQYIHIFPVDGPYLVTGVLLNKNKWTCAKTTNIEFSSISLNTAKTLSYTNNADAIGYTWKAFSFDTQTYTVDDETTYILKNASNEYYKLRFLDFYSKKGEKGNPRFEFQFMD